MNTKPKLSPWIPGSMKPVRDGVYERDHMSWGKCYSRFSEGTWRFPSYSLEIAAIEQAFSDSQMARWRGLAANPIPLPKGQP